MRGIVMRLRLAAIGHGWVDGGGQELLQLAHLYAPALTLFSCSDSSRSPTGLTTALLTSTEPPSVSAICMSSMGRSLNFSSSQMAKIWSRE